MTPAGIEPATFRFLAQHLNHCATAVPTLLYVLSGSHSDKLHPLFLNVSYALFNVESTSEIVLSVANQKRSYGQNIISFICYSIIRYICSIA